MNDGYTPTRILWRSDEQDSAERFVAARAADGWRLEGSVVLPIDGEPARIDYGIDLDDEWRTRAADVEIEMVTGGRTIRFEADGAGAWLVDGVARPALDGCIDIDFSFTPATNTLQVRRLGLGVGASETLAVAWLSFPELTIGPLTQTYTRLADDRWRYGSGAFTAELAVDPGGFVLQYADLWRAVAHRAG
jgi:hypothetical protein